MCSPHCCWSQASSSFLALGTGADRLRNKLGQLSRQPTAGVGSASLPDPRRKSTSALQYEWPSVTVSAPVSPVGELAVTGLAGPVREATAREQQIQSTFVVRDHWLRQPASFATSKTYIQSPAARCHPSNARPSLSVPIEMPSSASGMAMP